MVQTRTLDDKRSSSSEAGTPAGDPISRHAFQADYPSRQRTHSNDGKLGAKNVGDGERAVSLLSGAVLTMLGLGRPGLWRWGLAGIGVAALIRGATGHCALYNALGINRETRPGDELVHVTTSYLINKSPEELYVFWKNFENLPKFMSHLESVRNLGERTSHWVAKAPGLYGGQVEWQAEITTDEPNRKVAWRTIADSDISHSGAVTFKPALGDRGTIVSVEMKYQSPAGQLGRWAAKLFGEEPEQQIHDDLRNFKRLMEIGEIPTIEGQPRGTCRRASPSSA